MASLKDNQQTSDPRLDRLVQFDERSRAFPITATLETTTPRSYTWAGGPVTDQGKEGACVGHGWTGELTARPVQVAVSNPDTYAYALYHDLQHRDPWEGCSLGPRCTIAASPQTYGGTSTLEGAKTLTERGFYSEYRWAFGLNDLILAIGRKGPAVLGINWYDSMYSAPGGKVTVSGTRVGGHCILARGVSLSSQTILLRNSWGTDWGVGGDARISFADMDRLLKEDGEAVIPLRKAVI